MKITRLLNDLPDWPSFEMERVLRATAITRVQADVKDIVSRIMGDVLDWLRLTPNAVA